MSENSQSSTERCNCWCGLGSRIRKCCPRRLCRFLKRAKNAVVNAFRRRSFPSGEIKEDGSADNQRRGTKRRRCSATEEEENFQCLMETTQPTKEPSEESKQLVKKCSRSSTSSCEYQLKRRRYKEQIVKGGKDLSVKISLTLSSLRFRSVLGQGAFGKVFLASCLRKDSLVAVKMISKKHTKVMDILKEKRTLELARNSPFLCGGLAAFQTKSSVFFIMEYMPGGCLKSYMERVGCLTETTARFYSAEIVCGIQYLHSHGIIHRDLKPGNVLLDSEGHAKICDFGLVEEDIYGNGLTSGFHGTILYMAPEIILKKKYGAAVDWWSLGVMMFRMLNAGAFPFSPNNATKDVALSIICEAPTFTTPLSWQAVDILCELLQKNPQQRLGLTGDIKQHPFFQPINWEDLENRRVAPPHQHSGTNNLQLNILEQTSSLKIVEDTSCLSNSRFLFGLSFVSPHLMA